MRVFLLKVFYFNKSFTNWYVNRFEFPHLYIVSVAMLSIKPTSDTFVSVFSTAAKFMSKHRCAMEMPTIDMLSLNINYDLFEVALSKLKNQLGKTRGCRKNTSKQLK